MREVTVSKTIYMREKIISGEQPSPLLVSCVDPLRPHPSGIFARTFVDRGHAVRSLYKNSRSAICLFRDTAELLMYLRSTSHRDVYINVNGPLAQLMALLACRLNGLSTTLVVMDSYPGCLKYVTSAWWALYPLFFSAAYFVKIFADRVIVIDEVFPDHYPTWRAYRERCSYVPLPRLVGHKVAPRRPYAKPVREIRVVGIIGNIESDWLDESFPIIYRLLRSRGIDIVIASSGALNRSKLELEGVSLVVPWPAAETEAVFSRCNAILVPLSAARLRYSSPSKILDCYHRGIQPIVVVDREVWQVESCRAVYKKCLHLDDVLEGASLFLDTELSGYYFELAGRRIGSD